MAFRRCPPWLRSLLQPYSACGLQISTGIRDWAKLICTSIRQFKLTNTIFNNHDNSVYLGKLYTVSTDNPVIMFNFLLYSLVLCWGNVSNSKIIWNLTATLLFITKCWGGQKILCHALSKSWGRTSPPVPSINSVPAGSLYAHGVKSKISPSTRDEYGTGLGLDWIRTMTKFVEFGLDPACKLLHHKFRIRAWFGPS